MEDNFVSRDSLVTLTDDDGNEHDFAVIDLMELDEMRYAIMLPVFDSVEDEGEGEIEVDFEEDAYIFRVELDEQSGEELFYEVEDEEEWGKVALAWESRVEEMEEEEQDDYF
ncbi:MAG TPA: DUF1292 domain-containing protein [Firmicutes bacterium]|jgi:uncharacterized protein YrzB (UPF0473 family)|nr:DUF1292 domain-containing protein [Bacillota bacterium]